MISFIIAILFWVIGIIVMASGYVVVPKIKDAAHKLLRRAEENKFKDNSESIAYQIEGKLVDYMPWFSYYLVTFIIGMVIFVLGFIALSFHYR
ncbi:hypothetical protein [Terrilactibacillus laevilacticus]|uniref:hypothetical protein n=1 Tax=Terrilactibacillus laevilacticus TaxID=1380157 RepID=UPI0011467CC8|nr:hypothetical protein [Terrilactibacillus laevilacticus]